MPKRPRLPISLHLYKTTPKPKIRIPEFRQHIFLPAKRNAPFPPQILQMCSLDNWTSQLFHLQTQVNQYTWIFAFSCIFLGAYVVNVLIMANLTISYYKEQLKVNWVFMRRSMERRNLARDGVLQFVRNLD